jgi:hypothetical protein
LPRVLLEKHLEFPFGAAEAAIFSAEFSYTTPILDASYCHWMREESAYYNPRCLEGSIKQIVQKRLFWDGPAVRDNG